MLPAAYRRFLIAVSLFGAWLADRFRKSLVLATQREESSREEQSESPLPDFEQRFHGFLTSGKESLVRIL
jgi:hypothetical protein